MRLLDRVRRLEGPIADSRAQLKRDGAEFDRIIERLAERMTDAERIEAGQGWAIGRAMLRHHPGGASMFAQKHLEDWFL